MKAVLVFIDGTICDTNQRHTLIGTPDFYRDEHILNDLAVPGSAAALHELARRYQIVYLGARPDFTRSATQVWLEKMGFPSGQVFLAETQQERITLVESLRSEFEFVAGIGDRWDDNELHRTLGCLSVIVEEYAGNWSGIPEQVESDERRRKIKENEVHLHGKIEGLARVLPRLHNRYGDDLWEAFFESVMKTAEETREARQQEDLASFTRLNLNPQDLRDLAQWIEIDDRENWAQNPAYGLQDFATAEATARRYVMKITRCRYAELWQEHGHPEIGYQIHCRCDAAWWDLPAWNPAVRFEQPKTLMRGDDCCLFIQTLPEE